jgi:hypothetical protein
MHHILYNIFDFTLILGGKIHISEDTNAILKEHGNFLTEFRGIIDIKVFIYYKVKKELTFITISQSNRS